MGDITSMYSFSQSMSVAGSIFSDTLVKLATSVKNAVAVKR